MFVWRLREDCQNCSIFYHLRALRHTSFFLTEDMAGSILSEVVLSHLDYAISLFSDCTVSNLAKLQCRYNTAALLLVLCQTRNACALFGSCCSTCLFTFVSVILINHNISVIWSLFLFLSVFCFPQTNTCCEFLQFLPSQAIEVLFMQHLQYGMKSCLKFAIVLSLFLLIGSLRHIIAHLPSISPTNHLPPPL